MTVLRSLFAKRFIAGLSLSLHGDEVNLAAVALALLRVLTCHLAILHWPWEWLTNCTCSGLPLALCWRLYWPLKNLQVELFPLQIPQASRETLEPRTWSHPTACTHRETHVTPDRVRTVTMSTKTKKHQLNFLWAHPRVQTEDNL